ncbi:hypothetical protein J6590_079333 [Homalodisca vitripennis]|nr:hypothetical protein J6590_079333 [Homalodisca vitripennis]
MSTPKNRTTQSSAADHVGITAKDTFCTGYSSVQRVQVTATKSSRYWLLLQTIHTLTAVPITKYSNWFSSNMYLYHFMNTLSGKADLSTMAIKGLLVVYLIIQSSLQPYVQEWEYYSFNVNRKTKVQHRRRSDIWRSSPQSGGSTTSSTWTEKTRVQHRHQSDIWGSSPQSGGSRHKNHHCSNLTQILEYYSFNVGRIKQVFNIVIDVIFGDHLPSLVVLDIEIIIFVQHLNRSSTWTEKTRVQHRHRLIFGEHLPSLAALDRETIIIVGVLQLQRGQNQTRVKYRHRSDIWRSSPQWEYYSFNVGRIKQEFNIVIEVIFGEHLPSPVVLDMEIIIFCDSLQVGVLQLQLGENPTRVQHRHRSEFGEHLPRLVVLDRETIIFVQTLTKCTMYYSFNVGRIKQEFNIVIEVIFGEHLPSMVALDNLRMIDCFHGEQLVNAKCSLKLS